ncbi:MAG: histidinol dehydrogenase [Kiritimatiellia bacterium]
MRIRTIDWVPGKKSILETFLARPAFSAQAEESARLVLADIVREGDKAVCAYAARFDGAALRPKDLRIDAAALEAATRQVDPAFRRAAREAHRRIMRFSKAGKKKDWSIRTERGGRLGEKFVPYERVGVYVPGGAAPLASSALMTATLAAAAGVPEIVACTPCDKDGVVNPYVLYALQLAGATEIYRVGGIHAIGMMAYGTKQVRKVQKIVGPGGAYVTAAKRQVYGHVALDLVAGPSEIAVLADESANPAHVAMDLLSQAEHGTGDEKALLVTPSGKLMRAVEQALQDAVQGLGRKALIEKVAARGGILLVKVPSIEDGIALCNRFAPEHLELMVRKPRQVLKGIRCAGAVFLGPWTPESAGDFVAGPSHVLPTGGAAAMFSGLTVDDFMRRSSTVEFTRRDLEDTLHVIEAFGRVEGLDAHAKAGRIRFQKEL